MSHIFMSHMSIHLSSFHRPQHTHTHTHTHKRTNTQVYTCAKEPACCRNRNSPLAFFLQKRKESCLVVLSSNEHPIRYGCYSMAACYKIWVFQHGSMALEQPKRAKEQRRRHAVTAWHCCRTWAKGHDLSHVKGDDMRKVMALEYLKM